MNTLNSLRHLYSLLLAQVGGVDNDQLIRELIDTIAPHCKGAKSRGAISAARNAYLKGGACGQALVEVYNLAMLAKKKR